MKCRNPHVLPPKWWMGRSLPVDFHWRLLDHFLSDLTDRAYFGDLIYMSWIIRSRDVTGLLEAANRFSLQSIGLTANWMTLEQIQCRLAIGQMLKKYPLKDAHLKPREEALRRFFAAEEACSQYNRKGWKRVFCSDGNLFPPLQIAQDFISEAIGPVLPDISSLQITCRHGPGATTGASSGYTSAYFKYALWPYHVTENATVLAQRLIEDDERWRGALEDSYREENDIEKWRLLNLTAFWKSALLPVRGNKITFVPKDAKTHRTIAIEPTLNVNLQLGVDGFIRKRLKRYGINLDSQLKNQELARIGSMDDSPTSPVTLDLENASDSISLRVVKLLFPAPWFRLLCDLRSPQGLLSGKWLRFSKLSSMGNGYTFAVETLIFASLAYAACVYTRGTFDRENIAVYGDDIVIPKDCLPLMRALLELCGFKINSEKSFSSAGVRESCGTDWVNGTNVRPVYVKETPLQIAQLLSIRNRLYRWSRIHLYRGIPSVDAFLRGYMQIDFKSISGPCSDESFDTHWHTTTPGEFRDQHWCFQCIHERRQPIADARNFLFRKLMHSLRPSSSTGITSNGSAFHVYSRIGRTRWGIGKSVAISWQQTYGQPILRKWGREPPNVE